MANPRPSPAVLPPANYGAFGNEADALRAVIDRVVAGCHPRAIYLFGSRAEGRARRDSDFDLVVVFDDSLPPVDDAAVYTSLVGLGIGCDVIACQEAEFAAVLADRSNPWRDTWSRARKVHERPA